jgi:hypothetical protein
VHRKLLEQLLHTAAGESLYAEKLAYSVLVPGKNIEYLCLFGRKDIPIPPVKEVVLQAFTAYAQIK